MASGKSAGSKKSKAGTSGQDAEQRANGLSEELDSAATEASESMQEAAGELTQTFRQQITSQVTAQQERAVDTLETVALLLQQAGEHARKEEKASIAQLTDQAAEQVERLSTTIRDRQPDQLINEARQLAQKQPGLFVGGALLAGFLGARFLRSSAAPQQASEQESPKKGGSSDGGQPTTGSGTGTNADSVASAAPGAVGTETSMGTGAMTGVTDTSSLEGTILEEDAAILEELEREEMLRQEDEGLGGSGTDNVSETGRGSEIR